MSVAPSRAGGDVVTVGSPRSPVVPVVVAAAVVAGVAGYLIPDLTVGPGMTGDSMTHYMELLGVNQPWNLIVFMAFPVLLAETLAITELVLLFRRAAPTWVGLLSRVAGLVAGPLMVGIVVHLTTNAIVPLTTGGGWRGPADVIAVLAYVAGALPLIGITLVELGFVGRTPPGTHAGRVADAQQTPGMPSRRRLAIARTRRRSLGQTLAAAALADTRIRSGRTVSTMTTIRRCARRDRRTWSAPLARQGSR